MRPDGNKPGPRRRRLESAVSGGGSHPPPPLRSEGPWGPSPALRGRPSPSAAGSPANPSRVRPLSVSRASTFSSLQLLPAPHCIQAPSVRSPPGRTPPRPLPQMRPTFLPSPCISGSPPGCSIGRSRQESRALPGFGRRASAWEVGPKGVGNPRKSRAVTARHPGGQPQPRHWGAGRSRGGGDRSRARRTP